MQSKKRSREIVFELSDTIADASRMVVTEEGSYSLSRPDAAALIKKHIVQSAKQNKISTREIVDATAGNGGDTLSFLSVFDKVTAVEINDENFGALRKNIVAFGYPEIGPRLRMLLDDYTSCYKRFSSPIVYFDPPWGGPGYKKFEKLMLYMSDVAIDDLIIDVMENTNTQMVALKCPFNFDIRRFVDTLSNYVITRFPVNNFQLLIVTVPSSDEPTERCNRRKIK
jgi:16S rRNA G966 N2-methylase RsmD